MNSKLNYVSPDGMHRHKCESCHTVWEHSDNMAGNNFHHKCPKCGEEEWFRYFGPDAPLTKDEIIHTTIGVYPDGSYKVNGVSSKNIESHISYNKLYRCGRVLIVDGEIVHKGTLKPEYLTELLKRIPIDKIKMYHDSEPYH